MSLTYPVFMALFQLIRKARYDQAIDQFFTPYAAVKSPKTAKRLFEERGNFTIDAPPIEMTAKEEAAALARAKRKMARIIAARKKAAETAVFEEK